jgi:branched-chain amino acid transport system substrate-binding protein
MVLGEHPRDVVRAQRAAVGLQRSVNRRVWRASLDPGSGERLMPTIRLPRAWSRRRSHQSSGLPVLAMLALCLLLAGCDLINPPRPLVPPPSERTPVATATPLPSPAAAASSPTPATLPGGPVASAATPPPATPRASSSPAVVVPPPGASPVAKPGGAVVVPGQAAAPDLSQLSGTIKIVSSLPRTGNNKAATDSMVNGIRMAIDEIGSKIGAATIVYQDLDDATPTRNAWDAGKESENANQAVADGDVMIYIGPYNSGAARISIPILSKADLVMISPSNSYPGLTKPGRGQPNEPDVYYAGGKRNYTRVVPTDEVQGVVGAGWAKQLGAQKVYILDDADLYGPVVSTAFAETARKIGLDVVGGPEGLDPRAPDYKGLADKIKATNPDLVYFSGITENNAGRLWRDLRAGLPDNVKLMGPDGLYAQAFLDDAGDAANGAYLTFGAVAPSKLTQRGAEWYRSYKVRYGVEPEVYAPYAYEATKVALDAIRRAGRKDRTAIREAMFATKDYEGILGRWSIDEGGDTTLTTISGRQVKEGHFDDANAETLQAP